MVGPSKQASNASVGLAQARPNCSRYLFAPHWKHFISVNMQSRSVHSFFFLLTACLAATTTAAQLTVFRGTFVHSRERTEMEVLEDYLIGFDENNQGNVSTRINTHNSVGVGRCIWTLIWYTKCVIQLVLAAAFGHWYTK